MELMAYRLNQQEAKTTDQEVRDLDPAQLAVLPMLLHLPTLLKDPTISLAVHKRILASMRQLMAVCMEVKFHITGPLDQTTKAKIQLQYKAYWFGVFSGDAMLLLNW